MSVAIILIFICSYYNHYSVNRNSLVNIELLSEYFKQAKSNIEVVKSNMKYENNPTNCSGSISKELNTLLINIENAKSEIIKQHQNIFDANTVTFLITFLSALFFTLFLTYIIANIEQYSKLKYMNDELKKRASEADKKIKKVNSRMIEVDSRIAKAKNDWAIKLQYQEYLLKTAIERNNLTQVLNLVSVLGSHLAASKYVIKTEYATLVYMIQRKTHSLLKEKFKDLKTIRLEEKKDFIQMIEDCITYLSIDTLRDCNSEGLTLFELLNNDLESIKNMIQNIPLYEKRKNEIYITFK